MFYKVNGVWMRLPDPMACDFHAKHWFCPWGTVATRGEIKWKGRDIDGDTILSTLVSAPWQDIQADIDLQRQAANPPLYSLVAYNCEHWIYQNVDTGMWMESPIDPAGRRIWKALNELMDINRPVDTPMQIASITEKVKSMYPGLEEGTTWPQPGLHR